MSLFTPFNVPDFKPHVPPEAVKACGTPREQWVAEQLSVLNQSNKWQADKLVDLSRQFEEFWRQGTALRNEMGALRESLREKEISELRGQTVKEKMKSWMSVIAVILATLGLVEALKPIAKKWFTP